MSPHRLRLARTAGVCVSALAIALSIPATASAVGSSDLFGNTGSAGPAPSNPTPPPTQTGFVVSEGNCNIHVQYSPLTEYAYYVLTDADGNIVDGTLGHSTGPGTLYETIVTKYPDIAAPGTSVIYRVKESPISEGQYNPANSKTVASVQFKLPADGICTNPLDGLRTIPSQQV